MTVRAYPGRSLAERQLDRPRALSSRWVSAQAKVSSSDYCEETTKQLVGGHRTNNGTAYRGVPANAAVMLLINPLHRSPTQQPLA